MNAEATLLERIAGGDRKAVAACIEHYSGLVWSLARARIPNRADAEDTVQEIFMELWSVAGRFDPSRGGEATFISMLARRRIADRVRRYHREPDTEAFDAERHGLAEDAHARLEADLETARVRELLHHLEPDQRNVIRLSVWLGLSHGAIAERTGLPLGTVKSHLRRGLKKIRDALGTRAAATAGEHA